LILGVVLGWLWPEGSQQLKVVSNVFLRLIKCLLVPLVFSTLVVGIAGHGDDLKPGLCRLNRKTL
jgi:proton glutamate symport protein